LEREKKKKTCLDWLIEKRARSGLGHKMVRERERGCERMCERSVKVEIISTY
jgi:hypothetical protein